VILVTHDVAEAGRLAEEIVLLDHGRVLQRGTLRDLLLRPAGERVRAFLGRRAPWLALEVLRLGQVAADLPAAPPAAGSVRLAADMPLGQALVALANVSDVDTVMVDGALGHPCLAQALRARILSDLQVAGAGVIGNGPFDTRIAAKP
jgi:osmoprotectant transport system ATP-binding protein